MKNVHNLLVILFVVLIVVFTACKKEDTTPVKPVIAVGIISLGDLQGVWSPVSMQYNGKTYNGCTEIAHDNTLPSNNIGVIGLNITLESGDNFVAWNECSGTHTKQFYTLDTDKNTITFHNGMTFQIQSYDASSKTLVLKLTAPSSMLTNSVYTLKK